VNPEQKSQEPWKDPIVDRLFDYTKWHIGLNAAVLTLLASGLAVGRSLPRGLLISVFLLAIAGIAAGTLASSLSRREKWNGFLEMRSWPLLAETEKSGRLRDGLTMHSWSRIQHAALWAAILWGLGVATYFNFQLDKPVFQRAQIEDVVKRQLADREAAKRLEEEVSKQLSDRDAAVVKRPPASAAPRKD
jgi:hypothetical protein